MNLRNRSCDVLYFLSKTSTPGFHPFSSLMLQKGSETDRAIYGFDIAKCLKGILRNITRRIYHPNNQYNEHNSAWFD